jgi:hypothetical protein
MTVARRFIAGVRDYVACVPEGRLNSERGAEIFTRTYPARRIRSNPEPTTSVPPGRGPAPSPPVRSEGKVTSEKMPRHTWVCR